jgi:type VI secretion system secreted protein VgrG
MKFSYKHWSLVAGTGLAALLFLPPPGFAQGTLGSAASYAVLAGSTITNTGATVISGDVGLSPGTSITGIPAGQPSPGTVHAGDAAAAQAQADLGTMYGFLAGLPCTVTMTGVDLGGKTLAPGVYCFATSAGLTGTLTLDAQGDPAAEFIFQMGTTLTVADGSSVVVINGAQGRHVWWQVGSSATLGIGSTTLGNVLASQSITLKTNASLAGRALARSGAVTMDTNSLVAPNDQGTPTSKSTWGKVKSMYR